MVIDFTMFCHSSSSWDRTFACVDSAGPRILGRLGVSEEHKGQKAHRDAQSTQERNGNHEQNGRADNGKDSAGTV